MLDKNITVLEHDETNTQMKIQSQQQKPSQGNDEQGEANNAVSTGLIVPNNHHTTHSNIQVVKDIASIVEECLEGLSIGYSCYTVLSYDPELRTKYAYLFVGFMGAFGVFMETLEIYGQVSEKKYHHYRLIKEAIAGASIAALYSEEFQDPSLKTALFGVGIFSLLSASKSLLEIYKSKPFFQKKLGKFLQYSAGGAYNVLMGLGISDYLFSICEGFGAEIHPAVRYSVQAIVSSGNLLADMPITRHKSRGESNLFYKPAHIYRSFLYGAEISLFMTILLFDIITDIKKSGDIKDWQFGTVLGCTGIMGAGVMYNKVRHDNAEEHLEQHHSREEGQRLINTTQDDIQSVKSPQSFYQKVSRSCHQFWYTKTKDEAKVDAYLQGIEAGAGAAAEKGNSWSAYFSFPSLRKLLNREPQGTLIISDSDEENTLSKGLG